MSFRDREVTDLIRAIQAGSWVNFALVPPQSRVELVAVFKRGLRIWTGDWSEPPRVDSGGWLD